MKKAKPNERVRCFMLHETDRAWRALRRYQSGNDTCVGPMRYHNAHARIGIAHGFKKDEDGCWRTLTDDIKIPNSDPRWPTKCDACEYQFTAFDAYQVFDEHIMITDDGREFCIRDAPPGAMWYADWMSDTHKGPDGHCLVVRCPDGHDWMIDSKASNCTLPDDRGPFGKAHRCWVRHGTPPLITVDKNGHTCGAGAGSIDTKHKYHGFLGCNGAAPGEFT